MKKETVAGFLIATVILGVVFFYFLDFGEILGAISSANPYLYALAFLCIATSILAWGFRWKVFINIQGYTIKTREILGNLLVGLAINNMTPFARLGGEPVRAYLLKKRNEVSYSDGFASVLADGSVFLVVTVMYVILTIILIPFVINPPSWLIIALFAFGGVMFLFLLALTGIYRGSDYIIRFIEFLSSKIEYLEERKDEIEEKYLEFRQSFKMCLNDKKSLAKGISAVTFGKILNVLAYFLIFLALGHTVPILNILVVTGIAQIVLVLPITPGSLGIYEGTFVSAFVLLGFDPTISASAVLLQRLIWFWGASALGGYLGTYYGIEQFKRLDFLS